MKKLQALHKHYLKHGLLAMLAVAMCFLPTSDSQARKYKTLFDSFTVVAYGDGFTAGYGIERDDAWPYHLRFFLNEEYDRTRIEIINAGVSGDTAASGAARIASILEEKPDVAIVAFGMEDALRGVDPALTYKALDQILSTLTYNNIYVILAGFKAPDNLPLAKAAQYNSMFPDLAKRYKVSYLRYLLQDVEGKWFNLQYDGVFPNEDGHIQIAKNLTYPMIGMFRKLRR